MKLAMRMPAKGTETALDNDPREGASAEIIDLASRNTYPVVAARKGRSDAAGLAVGIGVVALLGAATLWGLSASRVTKPRATLPPPTPVQAQTIHGASLPLAPPRAPMVMPAPAGAPHPLFGPAPINAVQPGQAANPYASPTVVFDAGALPTAPPVIAAAPTTAAKNDTPNDPGASDFASRIGAVGGGTANARSSFDPKTTVTQGTMIPAVLETAINTDVPGYTRAVVSQDVRSFDGTRVLVPRSSRLIGQYQSGLQAGQKRAYVIWTRLIRPDGVSVALASPASAFDGSGGLPGKVDRHFFQRFGSSMLLSVIGGLSAIGTGGASLIVGGSGQSAANTALQQNGQIGPTIRVRMGEPIRVFTARDLDFSQAPILP